MTVDPFMDDRCRTMLLEGGRRLGVELDAESVARFDSYAALLHKWGQKINLSSRLEMNEIVLYHFLDSLAGYRLLAGAGEGALIDIGAGAGFPALPLKICLPRLYVTLVESANKKVSFCREVVRHLGLTDIEIVHARGEELAKIPAWTERFDWAVARALAPALKAARLCLPFLRPGGRVLLYKGKAGEDEILPLREEAERIGAAVEVLGVQVPFLDASRSLVVVTKCST